MTATVQSVNVIHALIPDHTGDLDRTGIDKRPVEGDVFAARQGLIGDQQYDKRHHGGVDAAVYAYAREDYDFWSAQLGRDLTNGQFGDNLTTTGIDVNATVIGETWRVGDRVVLRARAPRIPCTTFAGFLGESQWVKRFTAARRPGTYFAVVEQGNVRAGAAIEVLARPDHGATIADLFSVISGDRDAALLDRLRAARADLTDEDRDHLAKVLG